MLLPYTTLTYYGSGAGALNNAESSISPSLDIKANKKLNAEVQGGEIEPFIKMTRALIQYLDVTGIGELELSNWKKEGRLALEVNIGATPSAFDIAQAVWKSNASSLNTSGTMGELLNGAGSAGNPWITTIEGSYTAGDILKLMIAVLAGKTSINNNTVTFRDINDTEDRIVATMDGSERTEIIKNI
ncbi:MAG: hypothetical protein HC917_05525 [Richelia sp. SM2_1_7]|nr:hypothetical protein [Richelia sp. SM2_1_7]